MGRPSTYTEELGERICEALANSDRGLRHVLDADPDFPEPETVRKWRLRHASFNAKYADAKQAQLELMAEDIVDISMDESLDPNDKRVRIDARKWLLSKLMAKTYGDKLDLTSGGKELAAPAHLIDQRVQSIIMQAQARKLGGSAPLGPDAMDLLS